MEICNNKNKLEKKNSKSTPIVSPYAIVYNKEFYLIGIKEESKMSFYNYRIDRMKISTRFLMIK